MRNGIIGLALLALAACSQEAPEAPAAPELAVPMGEAQRGRAAPPEWGAALIGQPLTQAYPTAVTECIGWVDVVLHRYMQEPTGVRIAGWAWNDTARAAYPRIVVADSNGVIVGVGETSIARPDVVAAKPNQVTNEINGWEADVSTTSGEVRAYGVNDEAKTACELGSLRF